MDGERLPINNCSLGSRLHQHGRQVLIARHRFASTCADSQESFEGARRLYAQSAAGTYCYKCGPRSGALQRLIHAPLIHGLLYHHDGDDQT